MTLTKQDKLDAAVALVEEEAAAALRDESTLGLAGYIQAHTVATALEKQGVLVRGEGTGYNAAEAARKRLEAQAKRLLDEEASKPDARILRFSSRDHKTLPRLDGVRRAPFGNSVYYTTPEFYRRASHAVEAAQALADARQEELDALLERASAAGLPDANTKGLIVTYDLEAFRSLVEHVEHLRSELKYLVEG